MACEELDGAVLVAAARTARRPARRLLAPLLAMAALGGATVAASGHLATEPAGAVDAAAGAAPAPEVLTAVQGSRADFAASASPLAADPYGTVWSLGTPYADRIVLTGWAADPSTTGELRVDVVIDGVVRGGGSTVGAWFDLTVPAPAGAVTACALARNVGPGVDAQLGCRDLRPPPLTGGYSWMSTEPRGHPLRFNPCGPITIAYNPAGGPAAGRSELDATVAELRAASGLDLRVITTSEPASFGRPLVDVLRYGSTWSPILVGYSTPDIITGLAGGVAGLGGPTSAWGPDGRVSVSGVVVIDGPQAAGLPTGWGAQATLAKLLLHELGHVLGLGHVNDTAQIMNPVIPTRVGTLGPGDRTGLRHLGTGSACRRMPALPLGNVAAATIGEPELAPDGLPEVAEHITVD